MDSYIGTEAVICLIFSWSLLWKILIKGPNGKKKIQGMAQWLGRYWC